MKKSQINKLVLGAILLVAVVIGTSSCKAGCGCPKFQLEQNIVE